MQTLVLPYLVAGRQLADDLIAPFSSSEILIECGKLSNCTAAFVDQLVVGLVVQHGARLQIHNATTQFRVFLDNSLIEHHVGEMVRYV